MTDLRDQPEVIRRIAARLEAESKLGPYPPLYRVPAVCLRWDFVNGLLRVGSALQSDLEVHIAYLRIADVQLTFAQTLVAAAVQSANATDELRRIGEVMGGKTPTKLVTS